MLFEHKMIVYFTNRAGRLKKIVSAWVGLDAVFRADSEYHIKKILKNGLGGAQALSKFEF